MSLQATTTTTILLISFLLSTPTITMADIVRDYINNDVVSGAYYLAWAIVLTPIGGGISMFNNGTLNCPSFIVSQSNLSKLNFGIPIKFTPQISNRVVTSSNLNIAFEFLWPEPTVEYTTVWTVACTEYGNAVVLNGQARSDDSWFKLESVIPSFPSNFYSIWYGDKVVLYDRQPNGQIMLGLDKGYPVIVTLLPIPESSSLNMSSLLFSQGLLANKYNKYKTQ